MKYSFGMNMLFLQECGVFFATVHSKSETLTCKDCNCNKWWNKYCKQTWMFTKLEASLQITPIIIVSMNHARKPKVMTKTQNTCKAKTSRGIFIASWQMQHNCVKWCVLLVNEVLRLSFLIHLEYWTISLYFTKSQERCVSQDELCIGKLTYLLWRHAAQCNEGFECNLDVLLFLLFGPWAGFIEFPMFSYDHFCFSMVFVAVLLMFAHLSMF